MSPSSIRAAKIPPFLLYYLSKVKGLRVLALTWEIPSFPKAPNKASKGRKKPSPKWNSSCAPSPKRRSIKSTASCIRSSGSTCACPSLAYLLFYPELVANRVPYFMAGNEPVQMLALYYNHMAPKIAY